MEVGMISPFPVRLFSQPGRANVGRLRVHWWARVFQSTRPDLGAYGRRVTRSAGPRPDISYTGEASVAPPGDVLSPFELSTR
jgi:hypothetical protein